MVTNTLMPMHHNLILKHPESNGIKLSVACSRLSVSGDNPKSGRRTSEIWWKKIGDGTGRRAGKHCFKNLIPSTFKKTTLQGCQMSKCRHLRCRVTRVCSTTSPHVLIFLHSFYMLSLSAKVPSNIEAHPSKCCRFCEKNSVTCRWTKVPRVSLFNKELQWSYSGKEYFVLADVVDSLGCKLENLSDVSCLIVLGWAVWPEFTVLSRKLPHEQMTALWALERSESHATHATFHHQQEKEQFSTSPGDSVFEKSSTFASFKWHQQAMCKMGLTSLHDFYGLWPLYICRSLLA